MSIYLFVSIVMLIWAGYYGAVRRHSLHFSFDWVNLRSDDEKRRFVILEWRRKLRIARLFLVGMACFNLSLFFVHDWQEPLSFHPAVLTLLSALLIAMVWGGCQSFWMWLGARNEKVVSLERFPVRFAEWFVTPLYWLIEPFISNDKDEQRVMASMRDENPDMDTDESLDSVDEQLIRNALEFKDVRLRDCMIPRTEISGVEIGEDIEVLQKTFTTSGHSKLVIYEGSLDHVIGYCHALALFRKPKDIKSIVTPILTVPEAMPANDLMLRFLEEHKNLAIVVDEFGGTAGLVSMEDIIEQIFGEIQDEYDSTEDWVEKQLDEYTYLLSARHEIEYLNEKYGWELPEGEYDTLGGLVIAIYEDLPEVNEVIRMNRYTFMIESVQGNRLDQIRMQIKPQD